MPTTKPKPKAGGKLNKKVGPFPLKIWIGIGAGIALLLYLYIRNKAKANDSSTGSAALDMNPMQATVSPQQSASAGTPSPNSPVSGQLSSDVLDALGALTPTDYVTSTDLASQLDAVNSDLGSKIAAMTLDPTGKIDVHVSLDPSPVKNPPVTKHATAVPIKKTASTGAAFGGIVKTAKTKTGGTLTYYKSGRIVQKEPGKTAFTVKK